MIRSLTLLCVLVLPAAVQAQMLDESLLFAPPAGFHVGYEKSSPRGTFVDGVPADQTVERREEMVTAQIFRGNATGAVPAFRARMQLLAKEACDEATSALIAEGDENGYVFEVWLQDGPLNQSSGTPDRTFLKAIAGHDSLYVVQHAYRSQHTGEQATIAGRFLQDVKVCDARTGEHPCPAGMVNATKAPAKTDQ